MCGNCCGLCGGCVNADFGDLIPTLYIEDYYAQLTDEQKKNWETISEWFSKQLAEGKGPIDRESIPEEVSEALKQFMEMPVPGYKEQSLTGKDSLELILYNSCLK